MEHMPPSNRIAIHHCDDGFRDFSYQPVEVRYLQSRCARFIFVTAFAAQFNISPGTEISIRAREHDYSYVVIVPGVCESFSHLFYCLGAEGVQDVWSVYSNEREAFMLFVEY